MASSSSKKKYKLHTLMDDLSSEDYHSIEGTFSSSQFKTANEDEELFIKKYIEKTIEKEDIPAFGTGTHFHTSILEPHKIDVDCAVFDGKIRRGPAWEAFKLKHQGKTLITPSQRDQSKALADSVRDSPVAMGYIQKGKPEVSLFVEIAIFKGEIFAPYYAKVLNRAEGWIDCKPAEAKLARDKGIVVIVKVRADSLGPNFILDLKSTTGNARNAASMKAKISYYNYDLSASLYLDIFSLPLEVQLNTFIWTFASKDFFNCKSYKASPKNILVGRAKWMKALLTMASLMKNNWQTYDYLGVLEPQGHELDWLQESDTDFL